MPEPSRAAKSRGYLFTVKELSTLLNMPVRSIERRLADLRASGKPAYCESIKADPTARGAPGKYYDATSLGLELPEGILRQTTRGGELLNSPPPFSASTSNLRQVLSIPSSSSSTASVSALSPENSPPPTLAENSLLADPAAYLLDHPGSTLTGNYVDSGEQALSRHRDLLPILNAPYGSRTRAEAIETLAKARGTSTRTVRREAERVEARGLDGLKRHQRADAGGFRLPLETLQLVVHALVSNPTTTSINFVQRTLLRAVPDAMIFERGARRVAITAATVGRIKKMLLDHPVLRLLFADADKRKEYLRSYSGQVLALYGNDMWQLDMTRCDVEVLDPETGRMYRLRVQAVIDVYSGCIMGIAFSPDEDQTQADLVLMRALMRKSGPLADRYPLFGRPRRLYIDNGKTYRSEHFHRIVSGLGVEIIHSLPRVSHTRGAIERFFGTLHNLERTMPGYVGQNAVSRSSEELKRLRAATTRWIETGRDPGVGQRLQTVQEYQNAVLAWLIVEYHQWMVDGKTRLEHFRETAPASSLMEFDVAELALLFARRETRVVRPDGTINFNRVAWTIPNGRLGQYRGMSVLVLEDQFSLGERALGIAWENSGKLQMLGIAVPAPTVAASIEAADLRRNQKAQKLDALRQADELARDLTDPALMVVAQLQRELPVQAVTPLAPHVRGRLEAINPTPAPAPDLGTFGQSFLKPAENLDALLAQIKEENS